MYFICHSLHRHYPTARNSIIIKRIFKQATLRVKSRQHPLTSVTSVCTSVITVTRLVTVIVCVAPALLDLVVNDGVEVVIARLAALDDVGMPGMLAIFASLLIFTMLCEPVSGRTNDLLAFITTQQLFNNRIKSTML